MLHLLLVRHADAARPAGSPEGAGTAPPGAAGDPGLSEVGRLQAQALADRLLDVPLTGLYSSPMRRAVETAELIGAAHAGLAVTTTEALRERGDGVPEAEGEAGFGARVRRALAEVVAGREAGVTAVVSHSHVMNAAVCQLLGIAPARIAVFDPTSVTHLVSVDGRFVLWYLSDVYHLEDPLGRLVPGGSDV